MAPSPAPPPVALAAASVPPAKATGSIRTLAMVIVGALALAGLIVSLIFRLGRARHRARVNARRKAMWQSADGSRQPPWADQTTAPHSAPHAELPPRPDPAGEPDRITEFLEQLSKQAQADAEKLRSKNAAAASKSPAGEVSSRKGVSSRRPEPIRTGSATGPRSRAL